jgi:hypothetical protein
LLCVHHGNHERTVLAALDTALFAALAALRRAPRQ